MDPQRHTAFEAIHTEATVDKLYQLQRSTKHTDVTFIITDEEGTCHRIPAHRVILASQSEYFDRLLFGEMREAQPGAEIPLPDTPLEAFQLLLKYVYTGRIETSGVNYTLIFDIVSLADRFGFSLLKDAIDRYLERSVIDDSSASVSQIYVRADLFSLERTRLTCFDTMDNDPNVVLKSEELPLLPFKQFKSIISRDCFLTDEISIFRAVQRWMSHNNKTKEDAADLLKAVRLCEIPPQELFTEVEPSSFYDKDAIYHAIRVQQKPDWNCTNPRGKKPSENLFSSPETCWQVSYEDRAAPHWHTGGPSMGKGHLVGKPFTFGTHTQDPQLNYMNTNIYGRRRTASSSVTTAPTSLLVMFDDLYLFDRITLQISNATQMGYVIHISKDNKHWYKLIDYAQYRCDGEQQLCVPKQAARYLHFAPIADSGRCTVKLLSCSFEGKASTLVFKENGVLSPLEAINPLSKPSKLNNRFLMIQLNQPYSISALSFHLDFKSSTPISGRADVHILVSPDLDTETLCVAKTTNTLVREIIQVEFPEQIVNFLRVCVTPTDDQGQSAKKMKLTNGSTARGPHTEFSVNSLQCWST